MRAAVLIVAAWVAGNLALTAVMLAFRPAPVEYLLHVVASMLVAGFAVLLAAAVWSGRVGTETRQPRRAAAAAMLGLGTVVALTAFAVGWWIAVFAVLPLGAAVWLLRGDRLGPDVRPWPVTPDDALPATGRTVHTHDGSVVGATVTVPDTDPGSGPPHRTGASGRARLAALLLAGIVRSRGRR